MTLLDTFIATFNHWFQGPIVTITSALVIIFVGVIAGMLGGSFIQKLLHQLDVDKILRDMNIHYSLERFLGKIISYIIYIVAVVIALLQFNLAPIILYVLLFVVAILVILSILVAIKGIIPNMVCGLILLRRKEFAVGNSLQFGTIKGLIDSIDLFHVVVTIKKGEKIIIPNTLLFRSKEIVLKQKKK